MLLPTATPTPHPDARTGPLPGDSTAGQRAAWLLGPTHCISGSKGVQHGITPGKNTTTGGAEGQPLPQQGFLAADLAQCQNPDTFAAALGLT